MIDLGLLKEMVQWIEEEPSFLNKSIETIPMLSKLRREKVNIVKIILREKGIAEDTKEIFKYFVEDCNLKLIDIGGLLGNQIGTNTIAQWLRGGAVPHIEQFEKLVELYQKLKEEKL